MYLKVSAVLLHQNLSDFSFVFLHCHFEPTVAEQRRYLNNSYREKTRSILGVGVDS
jgi:hypothetical protein